MSVAAIGQIYYNVIDKHQGKCITTPGADIFYQKDGGLVGQQGAIQFIKLGIQANPGTIAVINGDQNGTGKSIMVGHSGIYELDDVVITSLYFVRPLKYEKDVDASDKAMDDGIKIMTEAEKEREQRIRVGATGAIEIWLDGRWQSSPNKSSENAFNIFWNTYNQYQTDFVTKYTEGLNKFQSGNNGIYKLPNPGNLNALENYDDLYNVIVDFIWE